MAVVLIVGSAHLALCADDIVRPAADAARDDSEANQLAREVFASDDYWWKRTTKVESSSAISDFITWIYETLIHPVLSAIWNALEWLLEKLGRGLGMAAGDWSKGVPFLWTIILLLVALVIWRIIVAFLRPSVARPTRATSAPVETLPQAEQLLDRARIALSQGDHRTAIRLAFLSLLAWLQDHGQLKYDPSRSNREYQRDLSRWPESVISFRAAAEPFERCWYGRRELTADQVQDVISLCQREFQSTKEPG